jgi:hypothetical protein
MSKSKLSFVITLVAFTGASFLLGGCQGWPTGSGTISPTPETVQGFVLTFDKQYDSGAGCLAEDIKVSWHGDRLVGPGEGQGSGDVFDATGSTFSCPTNRWTATTFQGHLTPGNWQLTVTYSGNSKTCQSPIALAPGSTVKVTTTENASSGCVVN